MKALRIIALTSIVSISMTSSVLAAWWNPFSWKVFSKKSNQVAVQQNIATSTPQEEFLTCNGSKYKKCAEGEVFNCPTNGEDAFCEKINKDEVKIPLVVDAGKKKPTTPLTKKTQEVEQNKVVTNKSNESSIASASPSVSEWVPFGEYANLYNTKTGEVKYSEAYYREKERLSSLSKTVEPSPVVPPARQDIIAYVTPVKTFFYPGTASSEFDFKFVNIDKEKTPLEISSIKYQIKPNGFATHSSDKVSVIEKYNGGRTTKANLSVGWGAVAQINFDPPIRIFDDGVTRLQLDYSSSATAGYSEASVGIEIVDIITSQDVVFKSLPISSLVNFNK